MFHVMSWQLEQKSRYQKQEVSNISLVHVIISKVADNYAVKNVWRSQNGYSSHQKSIQFISLHASPHFWRDRCFILEELFNKDPFFCPEKVEALTRLRLCPRCSWSTLTSSTPRCCTGESLDRGLNWRSWPRRCSGESSFSPSLPLSFSVSHPPQLLI